MYIARTEPRIYQHNTATGRGSNLWIKKVGVELVCAVGDLDHFIPLRRDLNGSHCDTG
jgi:hypothetical protein